MRGSGDLWITELVITYDGKPYDTVSIMEFRAGHVVHETQYFAEPFLNPHFPDDRRPSATTLAPESATSGTGFAAIEGPRMDDATGEAERDGLRVAFDRRLKLEFHGAHRHLRCRAARVPGTRRRARPHGDGGRGARRSPHREERAPHASSPSFRQSVFGRLAGYEDVNDADRLGRDPAMRWVVDTRAARL